MASLFILRHDKNICMECALVLIKIRQIIRIILKYAKIFWEKSARILAIIW